MFRSRVRRLFSRARLLVQNSIMGGGANVVSEALAVGVPGIALEIPGNVGLLDRDYPGYYPVGDEYEPARLLAKAEIGGIFYALLEEHREARKRLVMPEGESSALEELIGGARRALGSDARF